MQFNLTTGKRGRPAFAKDYGIQENEEGLISWDWVDEQLLNTRNYWVTTVRSDQRPHAVPVWGVYVNQIVYFGSNRSAQKTKNLQANPAISLHLESGDDVVIIEGKAEIVTDSEDLKQIAIAYHQKHPSYDPDLTFDENTVIFAVLPKKVFAWTEQNFVNDATSWVF